MKKFISWGAAAAVVFLSSCRETEEITAIPTRNVVVKQDSVAVQMGPMNTEDIGNINEPEEKKKDPPKEDIKW